MKTWTGNPLTLAALAATLTLAGCIEDAPGVAAAPESAPGDPAIYAPDGWPLQIGGKVSERRRHELHAEFVTLGSTWAVNVVNGQTYAARYGYGTGSLPDEDPEFMYERFGLTGSHYVYEGHFPATVPDVFFQDEHLLPEHLRGRIEYHEHVMRLRNPRQQREWEENRARMRAEGLLKQRPTPPWAAPVNGPGPATLPPVTAGDGSARTRPRPSGPSRSWSG
ncbi:MAG: hypothetical protein OXF01_13265 [Gemmatimonadetes bacterium]|nr:hypothetical protein [Gemmatimonadota bacterium]